MKRRMNAPIASGANARRVGQLGMSINANVEINAPPSIYGMRLPNLVQVPSENMPTIGWITIPANGAASQK